MCIFHYSNGGFIIATVFCILVLFLVLFLGQCNPKNFSIHPSYLLAKGGSPFKASWVIEIFEMLNILSQLGSKCKLLTHMFDITVSDRSYNFEPHKINNDILVTNKHI